MSRVLYLTSEYYTQLILNTFASDVLRLFRRLSPSALALLTHTSEPIHTGPKDRPGDLPAVRAEAKHHANACQTTRSKEFHRMTWLSPGADGPREVTGH